MRRRAAALLSLVALAATFGACGEDENNAFKEDYNEAVRPLSTLGDDIGASLQGAEGESNAALAGRFDELADRTETTRENLSRLDPPEDARDELDALVDALKEGVTDLRALADAARSGDPAEAGAASRELVATGQTIQEAEADLRRVVDG